MNPKAWSLNPCARGRHIETRFQNKLVESANRTSARSSVSSSSRRSNRKVDFSSVTIREYPRILGDNPSCSCGAPVTFDWHYYPQQEYRTLDEYERDFPHRRHRHQMKLPRRFFAYCQFILCNDLRKNTTTRKFEGPFEVIHINSK